MFKRKILIIDDEKGFTDVLKLNLESMGDFEVRIENDSRQAIGACLRFRPDLILLDIIMPNKEGADVAIEIKNNPILKKVPIVFLTATVTREEVAAEQGCIGGNTFVAKPSPLGYLIDSIERVLVSARS